MQLLSCTLGNLNHVLTNSKLYQIISIHDQIYRVESSLVINVERVGTRKLDGVVNNIGGTPSEGVDVASSSFPSVKNQGLIEPVGL